MKTGLLKKLVLGAASGILFIAVTGTFAHPVMYDFDGDGKSDLIVKRRSGANLPWSWFINQSTAGPVYAEWGFEYTTGTIRDLEFMGDYDGDGKWDLTVLRRDLNGGAILWYVLRSSTGTLQVMNWGLTFSDITVPQDYDGDGKMDFAVARANGSPGSNGSFVWYILRSGDGQVQTDLFGTVDDFPLLGGDYDGDHKADLAIVRAATTGAFPPPDPIPMTLYLKLSSDGSWRVYPLGDGRETRVISGDYDGDGRSDVAVWKPNGLWMWLRSSDNQWQGVNFGISADQPVLGDYDGDGKSDPAVYRVNGQDCNDGLQNYYYIMQSRDGVRIVPWGAGCDFPAHDHYQNHGALLF
jgi:hypothetical protein